MSHRQYFRGRGLLAAALLASIPQLSGAQIAPSMSGISTVQSGTPEEYWMAVRDFGRCFVHRDPADAFILLSTNPGSREELAVIRVLFHGESMCLGGVLRLGFHPRHVRGTFAEGLIRNGTLIPPRLALTAPAAGAARNVHEAARCYAAAHGDEVRLLVTGTRPGSPQERAAIERMAPDFLLCVPPEGRGTRYDATDLRYVLAEALLRIGPVATTPPPR